VYDVDPLGLDRLDRAVLTALVKRFGGGPVGLTTLAVSVGEEPETVEDVAEPFLLRAGLLVRTARGRMATPAAFAHLGFDPPEQDLGRSQALPRLPAPAPPGQPASLFEPGFETGFETGFEGGIAADAAPDS
jgi:Holliday junction DNA helicase RuvB